MASAILGGLSAGTALAGGFIGNEGAQQAANAIEKSGRQANALDLLLYGQQRQDLSPYTSAGANATNYLQYLLGTGGGAQGQVANGVSSQTILNKPLNNTTPGKDGKIGSITPGGANSFQWTPGSGNKRSYQFLYNDGTNDIYQLTGGGKGTGVTIDYAVVGKDGNVQMTGTPPIMGSNPAGGQGGQITDAMKNDPNFGSLMHDFSTSDFKTDPGYDFRLQQGAQALQRSAAAKGGLYSGGTLKDLTDYNQNFASNEYGNAYNRFQQNRATKYNQLAAMAGLGQVSAGQINADTGNLAQMSGQNTINTATNGANARASGYSSIANGLTGAANSGMDWYQMSQQGKG